MGAISRRLFFWDLVVCRWFLRTTFLVRCVAPFCEREFMQRDWNVHCVRFVWRFFFCTASKYDLYNRGCTITIPTPMCTMTGTKMMCIYICSENLCNSAPGLSARRRHRIPCILSAVVVSVVVVRLRGALYLTELSKDFYRFCFWNWLKVVEQRVGL